MLIDILSERGYYVTVEKTNTSVENTNNSAKANWFKIDIRFKSSKIRRG